jgi:hypothetical protein
MIETQLSLFLVNQPGVLADVCKTLGDNNINIRGISVSDTVDHAVVRLVVDNPKKAVHLLGEHGVLVVDNEVLALDLGHSPGEMAKVARKFARGKINIEYAYGTADSTKATVFFRVSDARKAMQLLSPTKKKKKTVRKKVKR